MDTPTFWLIHIASAVVGLFTFILFKIFMSKRMELPSETPAAA